LPDTLGPPAPTTIAYACAVTGYAAPLVLVNTPPAPPPPPPAHELNPPPPAPPPPTIKYSTLKFPLGVNVPLAVNV
jgi:hypothetical protein